MSSYVVAPDLPDVSLLSSWTVASPLPSRKSQNHMEPLGFKLALQEGISSYDLYFVNHRDIGWYATQAEKDWTGSEEPHEFASQLTPRELEKIADALRKLIPEHYGGKLVGRRPRFFGGATFFPSICESQTEQRQKAVKAIQNTLYLAGCLGISCVEVVAGAGIPGLSYSGRESPQEYRQNRMHQLAQSIKEIYTFFIETDSGNDTNDIRIALDILRQNGRLPYLALEIEPGPSFLLNSLEEFRRLLQLIKYPNASNPNDFAEDYLCLNIDIAHAFLTGYDAQSLDEIETKDDTIFVGDLKPYVAHFHLSDHGGDVLHGGMHAADLRPGRFHFLDYPPISEESRDRSKGVQRVPITNYETWLELAIALKQDKHNPPEKRNYPRFSGAIGIELETCHDINEVAAAIQMTRQWLKECSSKMKLKSQSLTEIEGALLVIDLGNSTRFYAEKPDELNMLVRNLCLMVLGQGGSVMSYTGDGFIALFEKMHFKDDVLTAAKAMLSAHEVCQFVQAKARATVTVRAGLHWGNVFVPTSGPLRDQVMGEAVVQTARLCDWLGHVIEPAQWSDLRKILIGATDEFVNRTGQQVISHASSEGTPVRYVAFPAIEQMPRRQWREWGKQSFKGLKDTHSIYLMVEA